MLAEQKAFINERNSRITNPMRKQNSGNDSELKAHAINRLGVWKLAGRSNFVGLNPRFEFIDM